MNGLRELNNRFGVMTWPPNSEDPNLIKHLWDIPEKQVLSIGSPTSQLTGLTGSAADILEPDNTAYLLGSSRVHTSTGQGCFGRKSGPTQYLTAGRNFTPGPHLCTHNSRQYINFEAKWQVIVIYKQTGSDLNAHSSKSIVIIM